MRRLLAITAAVAVVLLGLAAPVDAAQRTVSNPSSCTFVVDSPALAFDFAATASPGAVYYFAEYRPDGSLLAWRLIQADSNGVLATAAYPDNSVDPTGTYVAQVRDGAHTNKIYATCSLAFTGW